MQEDKRKSGRCRTPTYYICGQKVFESFQVTTEDSRVDGKVGKFPRRVCFVFISYRRRGEASDAYSNGPALTNFSLFNSLGISKRRTLFRD